jgi:hypothetical protein
VTGVFTVKRLTRIHAVTAAAAGLLAAGGVAIATATSSEPAVRAPIPGAAALPAKAGAVAPEVAKRFAVLRRARTATDTLAPETRSTTPIPVIERNGVLVEALGLSQVERRFGLNLALARRARNTSARVPAYVVPGSGTVCVAGGDVGVSCVPDDRVGQAFDSAVCGTVPEGKVAVYGMVPDGAADVALELRDGTRVAQDVKGNLLYATTDNPSAGTVPVAVMWSQDGRQVSVRVPEQEPGAICN